MLEDIELGDSQTRSRMTAPALLRASGCPKGFRHLQMTLLGPPLSHEEVAMRRHAICCLLAILLLAGTVSPASALGPPQRQFIRLERAVLNLDYDVISLKPKPPAGVRAPSVSGEVFFGTIMRRLPGDGGASRHYVNYAVRYQNNVAVQAWCDLDDDHDLGNQPDIRLNGHPLSPNARSFLVDLHWTARYRDKAIPIDRTMRIVLEPVALGQAPRAHEQVVRGMRGTVKLPAGDRDLFLFDGNADGIYTKDFGDGILIDHDGDHRIDVDPNSEQVGPLGAPFQMEDRRYEVDTVDPEGSLLVLVVQPGAERIPPPKIGEIAPDFEYLPTTGRATRLSDYRGSYVGLYFYDSRCGACAVQAPTLVELKQTYQKQGLTVLGVSFDQDRGDMEHFRQTYGETWPTTFSGHEVWEDPIGRIYKTEGPGVFFLIDPKGHLEGVYVDMGKLKERLGEIFHPGAISEEHN
jgi:peroxiredoxin